MSFSFAIQDSLSSWYHIVELAPVRVSPLVLLNLMNGVMTETVKLAYSQPRLPCLAIN